ncbi:hypothetical protein [Parvularcula sp. LCG005]|uniref:hypothetical protein n=1 Tax=Parvularcula sp. LCG005 TaxID=3078805 RepID=UPI0029434E1E|nr:hypothetical protein [Parvularcula sp. LCG005]WOI54325.1 hypothetical protein RUI03_04815 [Parvularcula sp. LCG005]
MHGFADMDDDVIITSQEVAERCAYASWATLKRAMAQRGYEMPRPIRRGHFRGATLKSWFRAMPTMGETPPGKPAPQYEPARERIYARLVSGAA